MKGQKGITLVALVITIIVMLILVGVTITIAFNNGLFEKTHEAAGGTNNAIKAEQSLAGKNVTITDGTNNTATTIDDIVSGIN